MEQSSSVDVEEPLLTAHGSGGGTGVRHRGARTVSTELGSAAVHAEDAVTRPIQVNTLHPSMACHYLLS